MLPSILHFLFKKKSKYCSVPLFNYSKTQVNTKHKKNNHVRILNDPLIIVTQSSSLKCKKNQICPFSDALIVFFWCAALCACFELLSCSKSSLSIDYPVHVTLRAFIIRFNDLYSLSLIVMPLFCLFLLTPQL